MENMKWDATVDVVVVGSGAGGMSAALTSHFEGLDVLLVEKTDRIGGSTAVSGGAIWIPLNSGSAAAGHADDTYEKVWEYLSQVVGKAAPDHMKEAFLKNGPAMLKYMAAHGVMDLATRAYSPDYYPDRPGAAMGGRVLDPAAFDGRRLGAHFKELRDPLKEFVVLGGMMVNVTDVYHLLRALRSPQSFWHAGKLVLRYWSDRLRGYRRGTRLLLGNALAAQLFEAVLKNGISYRLETAARQLHRDADGRIVGVIIEQNATRQHIRVRKGVVVATGGFPWNPELRAEYYPQPTGPWSMSPEGNRGDGILMAREAGAAMGTGHVSPAFWAPVSLLRKADGTVTRYPHLIWDRAKPGLIAVNRQGDRFVNESTSYHEFVGAMYRADGQPAIPAYLVCDRRFIDTWGLGLALPGGRARQHLIDAGYLIQAPTLRELASRLSIDPDRLQATVERYNVLAASGVDSDFGKGSTVYNQNYGDPRNKPNPCLRPLKTGPYYAVEVVAGDIGTACGIQADAQARVLDARGRAIPGLFVAGNDMQSVLGGTYPGSGITLGPALTFGWLAGRGLAQMDDQKEMP
ncbi:MAG: FAD-dependent oxidoreductase [Castellaniella sp.]|nr:FAD-dependent oxidoreductase [Castellaniella sp.]